MLITPLQQVCQLIESPEIEQELSMYSTLEQAEIFELMKGIMADEIQFVLAMYNHIGREHGRAVN